MWSSDAFSWLEMAWGRAGKGQKEACSALSLEKTYTANLLKTSCSPCSALPKVVTMVVALSQRVGAPAEVVGASAAHLLAWFHPIES